LMTSLSSAAAVCSPPTPMPPPVARGLELGPGT
jgi:hypothetical protein